MGQISVTVMVAQEEMDSLKMFCRGGENCCGRETNRLCAEGKDEKMTWRIMLKNMFKCF